MAQSHRGAGVGDAVGPGAVGEQAGQAGRGPHQHGQAQQEGEQSDQQGVGDAAAPAVGCPAVAAAASFVVVSARHATVSLDSSLHCRSIAMASARASASASAAAWRARASSVGMAEASLIAEASVIARSV